MGSIIARRRKDGGTSYLAQIVIKSGGQSLHRENRTFPARREAAGWIARREEELSRPGATSDDPVLADVIDRYTAEARSAIGKTKAQVLRAIKADKLAAMRCSRITSADVVAFAQRLADGARKPQTVQNYLSHLGAVFAIARPAWGIRLDQQALRDATTASAGCLNWAGASRRWPASAGTGAGRA